MIKRILNWFQAVKPNPTATDVMVQVGCHFEEVAEMCEALYMDETDTVLQGEADWFKHQKVTHWQTLPEPPEQGDKK